MMTFEGRQELVPIRTQSVPQTIETPVTFTPVPGAYVRFAYSRSSDSMASQIEGQDYLCFRHNDQKLVFIIADGVGSSFCGNLAARILGDNLLDWLWSADISYYGGPAALQEAATSYLNRLQKTAQREVEEYEIPDMGSPLIQQALEGQRAYGSEAVFAACRIDHPSPMIPEGLISIFWMGDTQIHVIDKQGQKVEIPGSYANANRWSTSKGVRGTMPAWMQSREDIARVVAFTDGLTAHADRVFDYPDDQLDREIRRGALLPTSDDVAFIDVVLRTPEYEGYPDPDLPDPNLERPSLEQIWNPTGAKTYELRWRWPGNGSRLSYIIQEATSPALTDARTIEVPQGQMSWRPSTPREPGHYYYRVRAVRRFGGLSPWSELRQTRVAHPAPPAPELRLEESAGTARLEWGAEGEMLEYVLERAASPDFAEPEVVFEGRSTSWTAPTDRPGTYYFRVRAISDGGPGPWSEPQQVVVTMPPPATPSLAPVSYGYTYGEYYLRWQPVTRADYYELEERLAESEEEPRIIRVEDASYHVEGQEVGHYVYRVRACHQFGCSPWSGEQIAVISPRPPADAPDLTVEGPDENDVLHLAWTAVPRATGYNVEVSEDMDFDNARIFAVEGLELGIRRHEPGLIVMRVCATNQGGEGPWSNVERIAIAPPAPDWIEAEVSENRDRVTLAWGSAGSRIRYRLEVAPDAEEPVYELIYSGPDTQYELTDLPEGAAALRFRVRAELPGVESAWVESEVVSVQVAPPAPRLGQLELDDQGQIVLRWSQITGADHYVVEMAQDESFSSVKTARWQETGASIRPPAMGRYWFRVRAVYVHEGSRILGEPSDPQSIEVRRPAAPRLHPVDPQKAGQPFTIAWRGLPNCTYYEIEGSRSRDFEAGDSKRMRVFHPEQKLRVEGQPAGIMYFRVKAVTEDGSSSPWSEVLAVEVQ